MILAVLFLFTLTATAYSAPFKPFEFKPKDHHPRVDQAKCPDFNGHWKGYCKGTFNYEIKLNIEYLYCIEFEINGHLFFLNYPNIQHFRVPGPNGFSETHTDLLNWDYETRELHMDLNNNQFYVDGDSYKTSYQAKMYREKDLLFFEYTGRAEDLNDGTKTVKNHDVICQLEEN